LAGCYTELPVAPAAPEPPPAAFSALTKGQSAAQVRSLLGEPAEIKPVPAPLATEIWVYRRKISEVDQPAPLGSREVPVTNPITGVTSTTTEPVYQIQTVIVFETVELLMIEQRLTGWKTRQQNENLIHPR
jgi:hypothetical protein